MEDRALFGPCVDIAPSAEKPGWQLLAAVLGSTGEFQVAMEGSACYGLRLAQSAAPRARPLPDLREATVVISGGTKVRHPMWTACKLASDSQDKAL